MERVFNIKSYILLILTLSIALNIFLGLMYYITANDRDIFKYILKSCEFNNDVLRRELNKSEEDLNNLEILKNELLSEITRENKRLYDIYKHMNNKDENMANLVRLSAKLVDIDPLLLVSLINSESSFQPNTKHKLDYVKGLGGINTRYWKLPNSSIEEQIFATAIVFKKLLELSDNDELLALHKYKGLSPLGLRQAKYVYNQYEKSIMLASDQRSQLNNQRK